MQTASARGEQQHTFSAEAAVDEVGAASADSAVAKGAAGAAAMEGAVAAMAA